MSNINGLEVFFALDDTPGVRAGWYWTDRYSRGFRGPFVSRDALRSDYAAQRGGDGDDGWRPRRAEAR